jgi:hypothetical protein
VNGKKIISRLSTFVRLLVLGSPSFACSSSSLLWLLLSHTISVENYDNFSLFTSRSLPFRLPPLLLGRFYVFLWSECVCVCVALSRSVTFTDY